MELHRRYAYRLIDSAALVEQLECGPWDRKLTNERQAHHFTKLETPEVQQEVWEMSIKKPPVGGWLGICMGAIELSGFFLQLFKLTDDLFCRPY